MKPKRVVLKANASAPRQGRLVREPRPAAQQKEACLLCGGEAGNDTKVQIGRVYARVCPRCAGGIGQGLSFLGWIISMNKGK
jgi:hypothetical protein